MSDDGRPRCAWSQGDDLMAAYHDREWGVPVHDDRLLFEFLTLEGAQAGLSWLTILKRRDGYRTAFTDFEIERVAALGEADVERLMGDERIIRNRAKITSTIGNARAALDVQGEHGSLSAYLWGFVAGAKPNRFESLGDIPAQTDASQAMSRDLKARGFRFVGPTICYAFMQAVGLVNDHEVGCYRYAEIANVGEA